ncbi:unnamed protein product, partial [Linum tenue]
NQPFPWRHAQRTSPFSVTSFSFSSPPLRKLPPTSLYITLFSVILSPSSSPSPLPTNLSPPPDLTTTMSREQELLAADIVDRGVVEGSQAFSVRVRRRLPDFLGSVNLKYVRLGYTYLLSHGVYFLAAPVLLAVFGVHVGRLTWQDFFPECHAVDALFIVGLLGLMLYIYFDLAPRSVYLVDFACFRPPNELKISKAEFIRLAKQSGNFTDASIEFQHRGLKNSGLGDSTYMPRSVFRPAPHKITLRDGREEAAMVMFGAVDDLLAATQIRPKDINILVVNCGVLNTTPSLASMVINHYKLKHNINSFNLGGMGCAAGIVAVDLARDLLTAYPCSHALVVSMEAVSYTWYSDIYMSRARNLQLVRTHKGMDERSFKSIRVREDAEGKKGISVSKDVIEVGGHALKANITTLGPLVLPVSEQFHFFTNLLFRKKETKPYIPDYKLAFEHVCILATSKKVLDELQSHLELTEEYMEASRKTLERFGNTSSSSVWYELAYLEANSRVKRGDRIWQIAFGSGFKCNSVVWKALRNVRKPRVSPWVEEPN